MDGEKCGAVSGNHENKAMDFLFVSRLSRRGLHIELPLHTSNEAPLLEAYT
jgi:hypothetical protein